MKTFIITIISAPEVTSEGSFFKSISIEAHGFSVEKGIISVIRNNKTVFCAPSDKCVIEMITG